MSTRLRVFVSSTMKDMGDARRAVIRQLRLLNLEPVNAEDMSPTGENSWDVLEREIDQSDILILLSGDTYGWKPNEGFGAGGGKSVTHLEVERARRIGLPVLPFVKVLGDDAPRGTPDADARDAFREEIANWATGGFRQTYEWIDELERKVRDALLNLFHGSLLRSETQRRRVASEKPATASAGTFMRVVIPRGFTGRDAVLFAGAGVSAPAGLPTAQIMSALFADRLFPEVEDDQLLSRFRFADVAAAVEKRFGRDELERTVVEAFDVVNGAVPTPAHLAAVRTFRSIITTNYDDLFERAARDQDIAFRRISANGEIYGDGDGRGLTIYQVDGSISSPHTLVVTEDDAARARLDRGYWDGIAEAVGDRPVIVVGHSLRDENARRVLSRRGDGPGLYVSVTRDVLDEILQERFDLKGCAGKADDFIQSFEEAEKRASALL